MERNQVAAVNTQPPAQERLNTEEGCDREQANYVGNSSRQPYDPHSKIYSPSWKNHPNFGWKNQQTQTQDHRPQNSNQYNNSTYQHSNQRPYQAQHNTSFQPLYQAQNGHPQPPLSNLPLQSSAEDRISRIETFLEELCKESKENKAFKEEQIPKPIDSFPSDIENNPRGETRNLKWEEYKAITLRSEDILEEEAIRPTEHNKRFPKEKLEGTKQGNDPAQRKDPMEKEVLKPYMPKAPFPQRLKGGGKEKKYSRFLDTFKSLHINIPFIEALQQMPSYIKCMKELLTKKSPLKGGQTIVTTKECSALIQKYLPTKKKNPGSFHIPYVIGDTRIDRGFCDLGASTNLMSVALMRKLQINDLKPTNIILQLADKT
ncbi:uncharacterized protein [Arachis hypogaea]|uniref:uncharacterized protein n=1 Tax=Arachis hypogaea TaxID=3818 RepID=UPI000DEC25DB|nr:uncharacterized protein LOC112803597 [Arachis hypogaea]